MDRFLQDVGGFCRRERSADQHIAPRAPAMRVRMIRPIDAPGQSGPWNGQYALQRTLIARAPEWFSIGADCDPKTELPWFWCWLDRDQAVDCARHGWPFVVGPNMLFANWSKACTVPGEREICEAASCRLMFTESAWYRDWIAKNCGPENRAPIELFRYPIHPEPGPPEPREIDLLIYAKNQGYSAALVGTLALAFGRVHVIEYTPRRRYRRQDLLFAARKSRVCAYLSDSDRGPLALAEIMLAGCPAAGTARGAPWCEDPQLGRIVDWGDLPAAVEALRKLATLDPYAVRARALDAFDPAATCRAIFAALDAARHNGPLIS